MSVRCRAGIAAFALLPALPLQGAPRPSSAIPFTLTRSGGVIVSIYVGGAGPFPFLVDTGAAGSVVGNALARRLALAPVARALVVTPTGDETRRLVELRRVSVGVAEADTILASVLDGERLRLDGATVDGILGQDFLSRFDYTIDYRRRLLCWGGDTQGGVRLALRRSEGVFLVDLPQPGDGRRPIRLVPDSGANGLVVFDRDGDFPLAMDPLPQAAELEDASGRRLAVEMRSVRSLRVGDLTLRDQPAAVVARQGTGDGQGDGLLPLHQFASVTFGTQAGFLVIRGR